ncbi:MAG: hypothetical protein OXD41_04065 [Thaumarchaeota archaeon]|nr:hypothetical protein [Nitrososphaerota archaeon]
MDCEFFTTWVIARPWRKKTRRPVPCPNFTRVVAALCEHAARRRGRVSSMRIPDGRGREAPCTIIIRKMNRCKGDGMDGKHIAFASNNPSPGPDAPYPRRRGIETSCKMPGQARMRAPGRDEHVGVFCLVV